MKSLFNLRKTKFHIGLVLLFTGTLLTILYALVVTSFLWNFYLWLPGVIFILVSFLLGGGVIYYLLKIFKRKFNLTTSRQRIVCFLVSLGCIIYVGFVGFVLLDTLNERPIQAFPFNDNQATYTVEDEDIDGYYWLHYNSPSNLNKFTNCRIDPAKENPSKEECEEIINHDARALVASSPVDLKPFVGKHVRLQGEFINTNKRCIADVCKSLNNFTGIKIKSISDIPDNWQSYQNNLGGYSLNYPVDWGFRDVELSLFDTKDQKTLISYTAFSPVYKERSDFGKGLLETPHGDPLLIVRITESKTLQQITDEYIKSLTSDGRNYTVKRKEQKKIDNVDAILIVNDTEYADPKPSYFNYFFVKDQKIYLFVYQSQNEQPLKIHEAVLSSLKFTN